MEVLSDYEFAVGRSHFFDHPGSPFGHWRVVPVMVCYRAYSPLSSVCFILCGNRPVHTFYIKKERYHAA